MTKPIKRGIEWMMCGVAFCQRGWGQGGSILDTSFRIISREYFHLVVRYPADQQLILVLLVTRGVASAGRACADRAAFLLVLAKSRCYADGDALMPYASLVAE
jgi:hypothetical protein